MNSDKKIGRIIGILLLLIFVIGVTMYQFLQSPLFAADYLTATAAHGNEIIISTLLGILSGLTDILIAVLLLPIFKRYNSSLAYLYLAFCILSSVAICIDNVSVLSLLDLSNEYVKIGSNPSESFQLVGTLFYEKHFWTHYLSLLMSCFPVFVLYYTLYISKLVPRIFSLFGICAVLLMFIEILGSIFGNSISMNMMIPMALIQLLFPIWLVIKGLKSSVETSVA